MPLQEFKYEINFIFASSLSFPSELSPLLASLVHYFHFHLLISQRRERAGELLPLSTTTGSTGDPLSVQRNTAGGQTPAESPGPPCKLRLQLSSLCRTANTAHWEGNGNIPEQLSGRPEVTRTSDNSRSSWIRIGTPPPHPARGTAHAHRQVTVTTDWLQCLLRWPAQESGWTGRGAASARIGVDINT